MNPYEHMISESAETPTVTKVWLDGERLLGLTPEHELLVIARMETATSVPKRAPARPRRKKKPGMARSPLQPEPPLPLTADGESAHDE